MREMRTFFKSLWRRIIKFFSINERKDAKEALVYPEDEMRN